MLEIEENLCDETWRSFLGHAASQKRWNLDWDIYKHIISKNIIAIAIKTVIDRENGHYCFVSKETPTTHTRVPRDAKRRRTSARTHPVGVAFSEYFLFLKIFLFVF